MNLLDMASIRIDGGTQSRTSISTETVAEYAQALTDGATMPPVVVFFDGADYWLGDGFHRFHAFRKAGRDSIPADVRQGTCRDARLHAAGANGTHGLRRTNEDKRRAVQMVLDDAECAEYWTDREIAKHCGVSHPFVAAIRNPEKAAKQQANRIESTANKLLQVESDSTCNKPVTSAPAKAPTPAVAPSPWTEPVEVPEDDGPSAEEMAAPEPQPEAPPEYTELDAARDQIGDLQTEIERLSDRLAVEAIDASEEEKTAASETIAWLRAEVQTLTAHLAAVTLSRDTLQEENAQLKKQCQMYRNKLDKLSA